MLLATTDLTSLFAAKELFTTVGYANRPNQFSKTRRYNYCFFFLQIISVFGKKSLYELKQVKFKGKGYVVSRGVTDFHIIWGNRNWICCAALHTSIFPIICAIRLIEVEFLTFLMSIMLCHRYFSETSLRSA